MAESPPPSSDLGKAPAEIGIDPPAPAELIADELPNVDIQVRGKIMESPAPAPAPAPAPSSGKAPAQIGIDPVGGSPPSVSGKAPTQDEYQDELKIGLNGVDWRLMDEYFLKHEEIVSDGDDIETTNKKVQMFIEHSVKCLWTKAKTMNYLYTYWGIDPAITRAECSKLKEENPQLFKDYKARKKELKKRSKAAAAALADAIAALSATTSHDIDDHQTPPNPKPPL